MKEKLKDFRWALRSKTHHMGVVINSWLEEHHMGFFAHLPQWFKAIFFLIPALVLLGIFTFYPIINSFVLSFYKGYNYASQTVDGFTIIDNYKFVLSESGFSQAVLNTSIIVFISVPVTIILGLLIAVAMNSIKPLRGVFQNIFFLPYVTNAIAIGLVFAFIFKGTSYDLYHLGLANQLISFFGGEPIAWIKVGATYWSAMFVILLYSIWAGLAFKIIVFLASIQGIDKQYYQAAQIDGASKFKTFGRITVPLISPMIFYILITSMIGAFKTYSQVVAIIGESGQIEATSINMKTIVFYIYDYLQLTALDGTLSYAAAAAIILFGIILIFTLVQLQVGKRRVHY